MIVRKRKKIKKFKYTKKIPLLNKTNNGEEFFLAIAGEDLHAGDLVAWSGDGRGVCKCKASTSSIMDCIGVVLEKCEEAMAVPIGILKGK